MILGGYLILPTTFDNDQRLRFNKGVLAVIIVALLTGGYSLTGLVWFACPSTLFRLDNIFIPVFSVSLFAFCSACYALAASPRYVFSQPSAPVTLALTVASAFVYGVFALMMRRAVKRMTRTYHQSQIAQNVTPTAGQWQDPGYYQNFNQNMHPGATRSPGTAYEPYASRSPQASFDGGSMMPTRQPSEEELVNQQMAKLLTRSDLGLNTAASRSTFQLEWPQGTEPDVELDASGATRQPTFDDSGRLLAPNPGGRKRSQSAGTGPLIKISRPSSRERGASRHQRAGSRDDRRREIEMDNLPAR
jgi:hypothetical protein